ncbi:MAG: AsmA family protein [Thiogranum sp.]|nr:AsmA family protein [Thiogranum sp.]
MRLRHAFGIVLLVLVLVIGAPLVALFVAPMLYADLIERTVQASSGLQVTFDDLELDLFPPAIVTRNLRILNPHVEFGEPLLEVEQFSAQADPNRYLGNASNWWRSQVSGVVLRSATDASGRSNWYRPEQSEDTEIEPDEPFDTRVFSFRSVTISDFDFFRIIEDQSHHVHAAQLVLEKQADERLRIAIDGSYRDQPLSASGTLALPDSEHARNVEFHASLFGTELHMQGRIGHDGITPGRAEITARAQDLSTLGLLLNQDLSVFAPLNLEATLEAPQPGHWSLATQGQVGKYPVNVDSTATVTGERLKVGNLEVQLGDSQATAQGVIDRSEKSFSASLTAPRLDLDPIPYARENERPQEPLDLARLERWSLDIDARIDELLYQGYQAGGLRLEADSDAGSVKFDARLEALESTTAEQPPWQLVAPLKLNGSYEPAPEDGSAGTLRASFSTRGLEGELETPLPADANKKIQVQVQMRVDDFSVLRDIDTSTWEKFLPIELSTEAQGTPLQLTLDPLKVTLSDDQVEGQLSVDRSSEPLRISGTLHGSTLDLNRVTTIPKGVAEETEDQQQDEEQESGPVFSDEAIDWSWLEAVTLDLALRLDQFTFNQSTFRNVRTELTMQGGKLDVEPFDADLEQGGVRGHLRIQRQASGAAVETRLIATELVPADLGRRDKGLIDGGETDLLVDLKANGASPHDLAATLQGEMAMEVQHATIRNDFLDLIGSDILTQTFNLINPFAKKDDRTELECAALRFTASDGLLVSPDQIVIETGKLKIRGGGEINLSEETLRIDLVPSAREGLGISVGDLARLVRLGGTLSNPQPVADPEGVLKTGATIGAAIATGGVSLLAQGLFNRARNVGTACGEIFEDVAEVPEGIDPSEKPDADADAEN